jgi:hypothetical protein
MGFSSIHPFAHIFANQWRTWNKIMMSLKTLESNEGRSIIDTKSQVSLTFLIEFPIVIVAVLVVS